MQEHTGGCCHACATYLAGERKCRRMGVAVRLQTRADPLMGTRSAILLTSESMLLTGFLRQANDRRGTGPALYQNVA